MKKTIFILVLTILVATTFTVATAVDVQEEKPLLSEMSESECISFIKEHGIELPAIYDEEAEWGSFIKRTITMFENDPYAPVATSYTITAKLEEKIRDVVNAYYGAMPANAQLLMLNDDSTSTSGLIYSTVHEDWDPNFEKYNCYSFALGITDAWFDPGMITAIRKDPSSIENWDLDISSITIEEIRDLVIEDLKTEDNSRIIYKASSMDTSNLCINESVICVRKGHEDYHFMKYTAEGWLHKPSSTQILKYIGVPTEGTDWTNERVYMNSYKEPTTTYDSTIYFISYNGHDWNMTSNSNGTHTKSCSICGDSFTYSCDYSYTYAGENRHTARCTGCNRVNYYLSCTLSKTSNGNGYHTVSCGQCDHVYTEICNLEYTNITNTRHSASCTECGYYVNSQLCSLTYTSRGNKTHTASCSQCNNTYTGNCSITYSYLSANQHRGSCNKCSYTHTASCYYLTTYCGNSSLGDVHKKQCQTCGHISGSATTACSLIYKSNGNNTHSYQCTQCGHVKSGPTACMFKSDNTCKFCGAMKNSAVINDLEQEETA